MSDAQPSPPPSAPARVPEGIADVSVELTVGPLSSITRDLPGLLSDTVLALLGMLYPLRVARKAAAVVSELVGNALENVVDPSSSFHLSTRIDGRTLVCSVRNTATPEAYAAVRDRVAALSNAESARELLRQAVRARRPQRLKGAFGLLRLVSENHFTLRVSYEGSELTVRAEYPLEQGA